MAKSVEITPVLRRITCDEYGHSKLLFTVTNVHAEAISISTRITGELDIRSEWFETAAGSERSLGPHATVQLLIEAHLPPQVAVGEYRLRLEVTDLSQSTQQIDTSPSVLLNVPSALKADPTRASPDSSDDPDTAKKKRSVWSRMLTLLLGLFGPIGSRIGSWFWGGQPAGMRTVDISIVKKALFLIAIVFVASSISAAVPPSDHSIKISESTVTCDLEADHESKACEDYMTTSVIYNLFGWLGNLIPEPDIEFKNVCELFCGSGDG